MLFFGKLCIWDRGRQKTFTDPFKRLCPRLQFTIFLITSHCILLTSHHHYRDITNCVCHFTTPRMQEHNRWRCWGRFSPLPSESQVSSLHCVTIFCFIQKHVNYPVDEVYDLTKQVCRFTLFVLGPHDVKGFCQQDPSSGRWCCVWHLLYAQE